MGDGSSSDKQPPGVSEGFPPVNPLAEDTISLLNRAKTGDEKALELLCARYLPRLYKWATGRLPPHMRTAVETSDLVQETFLSTIGKLQGFDPRHPGAFPAYLRKALLNRLRNAIRDAERRPKHTPLDGSEVDVATSSLERTIGREQVQQYEKAVMQLKETDRAAIFLRIELEMNYEEIADALKKPSVDAARMAVRRALFRLAREMSDEDRQ